MKNDLPGILDSALTEHGVQYTNKQKMCFFGSYASAPNRFRVELGEKKTFLSMVRHVKNVVDQPNENGGLSYFADKTKLPNKKSYERNMISTVFGMVFGSLNEKRQIELADRAVELREDLFKKAKLVFTKFEEIEEMDLPQMFAIDNVIVRIEADKTTGKVICPYCNKDDLIAEVSMFIKTSGKWVMANLNSHMIRKHCKIDKQPRKFMPPKQTLLKLDIAPIDFNHNNGTLNKTNALDQSIEESIEDAVYKQLSAQCIKMTNIAINSREKIVSINFGLRPASSIEDRAIKYCRVSSNGDCFFLAAAHQLFGGKIGSKEHQNAALELRTQVVTYIKQESNFPRFIHVLKDRITYPPKATSEMIEIACAEFLDELSLSGCWGGQESIKAISELENINIIVFNDDESCNLPNHYNSKSNKSILLLFSAIQGKAADRNSDRNHYDSIIGMNSVKINVIARKIGEQEDRYLKFIEEASQLGDISLK